MPVIISDADHCGAAGVVTDDVVRTVDPEPPDALRRTVEDFSPEALDPGNSRDLTDRCTWNRVAEWTVAFGRSLTE